MGFNLSAIRSAVCEGSVARVVVAGHKGSVPRETGASMLVMADRVLGTIGGGALELQAIARASDLLVHGGSRVDRYPLGPKLGQCCGGAVTLVTEVFSLSNLPDASVAFSRRVEGVNEKPLIIKRCEKMCRNASGPVKTTFSKGWIFEPLDSHAKQLWLYGAGHVGRAVVEAFAGLPVEIIWVDTEPSRFPDTVPDHARPLVSQNPGKVVQHAPEDADHLILTYSHSIDLELCHAILSQPFGSIGLIGSATKRARFQNRLTALGHSSAQIARITCPIGDPDLGKAPKAIALGVAVRYLRANAQDYARGEAFI